MPTTLRLQTIMNDNKTGGVAIDSDLLPNTHPGILLKEDFLDEMGITPYRLARDIGLTPTQVSELLKGRRSITPKTALLLGKFFDTSPEFFLNLQARYEMVEAKRTIGNRLDRVRPFQHATLFSH